MLKEKAVLQIQCQNRSVSNGVRKSVRKMRKWAKEKTSIHNENRYISRF